MLTITAQQGRERYKAIPRELQDLIFAETTKELFDHIGEENHLTPEKIYELGRIAGLVLLGFLHKDDTRKELQEALAINPMIANELQNELNKKLFNPVADILEKIYSPISKNTLNTTKSLDSVVPLRPVSLDNMPTPAALPAEPQKTDVKSEAPKPFVPSVPPAAFPSSGAPAAIVPPLTDVTTKKSPLTFTGSPTPITTPSIPTAPKPMPFVTQTNSQSAPVGNVPKFKIETPGTMTGSAFGGSSSLGLSSAPRPAKIELGFSTPEKKVSSLPSTTFETQKSSVRYGTPSAPSFSNNPATPQNYPLPTPAAPNLSELKQDAPSLPAKKIEVTMSGLKIPPAPPKNEPPKPLL